MAAVVVLPLVAETSSEPSSSSRDMRSSASGKTRSSIRPGVVVPPPAEAPTRGPGEAGECERDREHQPVALGTMTFRHRRCTRTVAGVAPIRSPSA